LVALAPRDTAAAERRRPIGQRRAPDVPRVARKIGHATIVAALDGEVHDIAERRISAQVMIAKTLFFTKTFCTYSTKILRQEKSLRDHETFSYAEISWLRTI
jgi:hypothetical protein